MLPNLKNKLALTISIAIHLETPMYQHLQWPSYQLKFFLSGHSRSHSVWSMDIIWRKKKNAAKMFAVINVFSIIGVYPVWLFDSKRLIFI